MLELNRDHPEIKLIRLSRNFGHQCALTAGINHAVGKAVILMDGDLQDSPQAILKFIHKWQQGYDVVYAIRENYIRLGCFTEKKSTSRCSNFSLSNF
ncbi:MAG: hypothetical protein Kow0049_06670 [Stanieria sp.]